MTTIYKEANCSHRIFGREEGSLLVVDEETNRILYNHLLGSEKKSQIPVDIFAGHDKVAVRRDLIDCHISICSPDVLSLFADNYDYQTRFDFIKGILEQEEILGNTVYLHTIDEEYAARISDLEKYRAVSLDIVNRWVFPVVPDVITVDTSDAYIHSQQNVYRHKDVTLARSCCLTREVVVGGGTKIGNNSKIMQSIIGRNCTIGDNVICSNAFIWDGVAIEDGSTIEMSVLANGVRVKGNSRITGSIVSYGVTIEPNRTVENTVVGGSTASDDNQFSDEDKPGTEPAQTKAHNDSDSEDEAEKCPWGKLIHSGDEYVTSEYDSDEDEFTNRESPHLDDTNVFYREVLDTLIRGIQEKLKCDNLVLEVNSLKYIYNVTVSEVNHLLTKAILEIPCTLSKQLTGLKEYVAQIKPLFSQFLPLIKNYIKNQESQLDFLNAHKEYFMAHENLKPALVSILHVIYDKEIIQEENLLSWYEDLDEDDVAEKSIKDNVSPLVNWLNQAEEESD